MTTTPARPTFTPDARGNWPCPNCNQAFTRHQGVSRHWSQQHSTFVGNLSVKQPDDDEETFSPEVEALHAQIFGTTDDIDQDNDQDDEQPATTLREALNTAPATAGGVWFLPPETVHPLDANAILALSDATTGLVDAITRLVHIGYDRTQAIEIVTDLINRLADQPTAPAA